MNARAQEGPEPAPSARVLRPPNGRVKRNVAARHAGQNYAAREDTEPLAVHGVLAIQNEEKVGGQGRNNCRRRDVSLRAWIFLLVRAGQLEQRGDLHPISNS